MRFQLQTGTEEGFALAPPELRPHLDALLASNTPWDQLPRETQAIGLTLGSQGETRAYLEALAIAEPPRALDVGLRSMQYSLAFSRTGARIVRVLQRTGPTSVGALLHPDFWRQLRRVSWDDPALQAELAQVADAHAPTDFRLRAGLAYVFPDDARWWSNEDRARAQRFADGETGALLVLALARHVPQTRLHLAWPPLECTLSWLDPEARLTPASWCRSIAPPADTEPAAVALALRNASDPRHRATLAAVVPTREFLRRAHKYVSPGNPAHRFVREVLLELWARELEAPGAFLPLVARDGSHRTDPRELAAAHHLLAEGNHDELRRRFTDESLARFVEACFVRWLIEGTPAEGLWTVRAQAAFLSDRGAEALADIARGMRNRELLEFLARAGTHRALVCLAKLSAEAKAVGWPAPHQLQPLLEQAAAAQGLPLDELLDRLFPPLELQPRDTLTLGPGNQLRLMRRGRYATQAPELEAAQALLPSLLGRLEHRMALGEPMSALHFTECWGLHPVLSAVAARLAWGVFVGGVRLRWFIPDGTSAGAVVLDERHTVRPLHPLELTRLELEEARARLEPERQPFPQLGRRTFDRNTPPPAQTAASLQGLVRRLARLGWQCLDLEGRMMGRDLGGRTVLIELEVLAWGCGVDRITWGDVPPRVVSEVQLELKQALLEEDAASGGGRHGQRLPG